MWTVLKICNFWPYTTFKNSNSYSTSLINLFFVAPNSMSLVTIPRRNAFHTYRPSPSKNTTRRQRSPHQDGPQLNAPTWTYRRVKKKN